MVLAVTDLVNVYWRLNT